ncbi:helicase HerA-like domain-containing protein [Kocuria carniphila]|uniref:helicase HerA-like domain-containing protein n=1 Tax=Kocuria carniphila TaxID=262208 RepID=UPI0028E6F096|nr:helicase HerA-like domain-containing protein [Kocuria carniphila]
MAGQALPGAVAQLDVIRSGYTFDAAALELGAALDGESAHADAPVRVPLATLNRHGLVAGATGTGKTKTLQAMAEQLSAQSVPVFLADIKGDLSGLAEPGADNPKVAERAASVGQDWTPAANPVEFLSLGGQGKGVPIRATVTSFGPTLLSKVLGLNATQESSLGLVFHYADSHGLALLDLKDLREVIMFLTSDEGKDELKAIGGLSKQTAGVILRELTTFANQGADVFFGEPEFDTSELLRTAQDGRGIISCLELADVQDRPQLFSTFLMWLLADLFQDLPEVGDADKPKLVFFFDEAHLLFNDASKEFLDSIEQTVRLIRSKGVGIFFVTQSPKDVPAGVLAQLGNRVQHALRAFTPDDAKALKAAARTYPKSSFDLEELLTQLGTGEAVVTVLSENGAPTPVAWTRMRAPQSLMSPASAATVDGVISASPLNAKYAEAVDRESDYELLRARMEPAVEQAPADQTGSEGRPQGLPDALPRQDAPREAPSESRGSDKNDGGFLGSVMDNPAVRSMMRSAGTALGREITRSIFGTSRRRRRR